VKIDGTDYNTEWVDPSAGGGGFSAFSDQVDQATVAAAVDTLYVVTTGATNATCTVNLPSPSTAGKMVGIVYFANNAETDRVVVHPAASDQIDAGVDDVELPAPGYTLVLTSDGDGVNWYTTGYMGSRVFVDGSDPSSQMKVGDVWIH
jgi:hypothetical protein